MVKAFGWCNDSFDPHAPGRLCRGRERWIEGLPDTPPTRLHRTVMSGATFSDDSARDAKRGFSYSGVSAGRLLHALFPGHTVYAFTEHGDPRTVPPGAILDEDHVRPLHGGLSRTPVVRWIAPARPEQVDAWILGEVDGRAGPRADGFVILPGGSSSQGALSPKLLDAIHLLVGFSVPDERPNRKYSALALVDVLQEARAVALLHLDKHAPVVAVYTVAPLASDGVLDFAARSVGAFPVPFAIPPMLARWDRALYDLRMDWNPATDGEFPVPPAEDAGGRWSNRRQRHESDDQDDHGDDRRGPRDGDDRDGDDRDGDDRGGDDRSDDRGRSDRGYPPDDETSEEGDERDDDTSDEDDERDDDTSDEDDERDEDDDSDEDDDRDEDDDSEDDDSDDADSDEDDDDDDERDEDDADEDDEPGDDTVHDDLDDDTVHDDLDDDDTADDLDPDLDHDLDHDADPGDAADDPDLDEADERPGKE